MHTDARDFQGQELFSAPDTRAGSIASLPSFLHAVRGFRIYVRAQDRPVNRVTMMAIMKMSFLSQFQN